MSRRLAALRRTLDAMPSPVEDRPGLLLRDPFAYAEDVVVIPPPLVPFLQFFDGEHEEGELAEALYRATGDLQAHGFATRLADTLGGSGFLEDAELARRRDERHRTFAESERRPPSHAGQAYPQDPGGKKITASFLYSGTRALFEQNGFTYLRPKGKNHCVLSRTVEAAR